MQALGNWKGWAIAGAIVLLEIVAVVWALSLDNLSPPSELGRSAQTFEKLELPIAPGTIVAMDQPGDATPLYQKALTDYAKRPIDYGVLDGDESPDLGGFPAFGYLKQATHMRDGSPLTPQLVEVVRFGAVDREPLIRMKELADLTLRIAAKYSQGTRKSEATELFEAVFSLGSKLWNERLVYQQAELGLELMASSAAGLQMMAEESNDKNRSYACASFNDARSKFIQERVWTIWKPIADNSDAGLARHAGDLFVMSTDKMNERMWRVEATLKLGYLRNNIGAGRRGDQVGAMRRVTEMKESEQDQAVKQAAKVAAELSESEFRRR
jgi:hypothetical protein